MAPKLSGYFDGLFWNRLLLQLGQSEPTIRHAMIAVSSMYEQFEANAGKDPLLPAEEDRFALTSYNKAISSLARRLSSDTQSVHVPLVACVLFICLEFLRRDIDSAMTHMHSGFAILRSRTARLSQNKTRKTTDEKGVEDIILAMFARLRILSGLFGRPAPPMQVYEGPIEEVSDLPLHISTFSEARSTLHARSAPCLIFIRICGEARYDVSLAHEYYVKQATMKATLTQWKATFEDWFSKRQSNSKEDHLAANLLRLHHSVTDTWLATCLRPNETSFDEYTDAFKEMVNLAASLVNAPQAIPEEPNSHFSFEMGTVPPLYFIAVKCRHPAVRRRAIGLLLAAPRREGLWDSYRAGRVAERVMLREELGFEASSGYESAIVQAHRTNEFPNQYSQGQSVRASRTVPLFRGTTDAEARSILGLEKTTAKEYCVSDRYNPSNTEELQDVSQASFDQVAMPPERARIHAISELPGIGAYDWKDPSIRVSWPLTIEEGQLSPGDARAPSTYGAASTPPSLENTASPWTHGYRQIPPRKFPMSDPTPSPWLPEEFRIHNTTYPERDMMGSQHSDKARSWANEIVATHSARLRRASERGFHSSTTPPETVSPVSGSRLPVETRRISCSYPETPDSDVFPSPEERMPGEEQRIHDIMPTKMPGELQRIHDTRISNEVAAPFKQTIQPVTFRWKPNGLDGDWQVWGETIRL